MKVKQNLILGLMGTLVSLDKSMIVRRSRLQYFLDYVFKNYNVSIWSCLSKEYTLKVIKKYIIGSHCERKLDYIFYNYHCKLSEKYGKCSKDIEVLKNVFGLTFEKRKTLIVDSDMAICKCQNANAIRAPIIEDSNDDFLSELITRLERWRRICG